jgi:hypothetical protein
VSAVKVAGEVQAPCVDWVSTVGGLPGVVHVPVIVVGSAGAAWLQYAGGVICALTFTVEPRNPTKAIKIIMNDKNFFIF